MGKVGKLKTGSAELYDSIAARASAHILAASRAGRDIAPVPAIKDRTRRTAAAGCLRTFLETYFPTTFTLEWSYDHLAIIAKLQSVIENGGQYALAMPRGSGKTSIVERAALWAVLTGRRRFVTIIAANESLAEQSLGRIKAELEHNPLLLADWPKGVYPLRRLESQARRCVGQLHEGERTCITWQRKRLVLPTMPAPDNEASGAVMHVAGLTGAIRGLSHVDVEGRTIRPDLVLVDDPQDRESARSVVQTAERLALLHGDLLGLSGPGRRIAALVTCTVIHRGDLADQLLDGVKSPAWQGERFKLVTAWGARADLWEEYAALRAEGFRPGGDKGEGATNFYRRHRAEMDAGAGVAWPARFEPGELSAIQHAYNLRIDRGEDIFASEYQNEPIDHAKESGALDPVAIAGRCGGFERGIAPPECEWLTAFIDLGQHVLWWMVCGWDDSFGCHVVDYGCWPKQLARVFVARNASPTLDDVYSHCGGAEGAIHAGLSDLVSKLTGREWTRSDGAVLPLRRCMIDAGWATDVVRLFVRGNEHREKLAASKGVGIGPGQTAIADYRRRPGEKIGDGWILGVAGPDRIRILRYDTNHWKTRVAGMLMRPMGTKNGVMLYGQRASDHEMLAMQLTSEYPTRMEARGNVVNVWTRRPDRDNHWFDCLVGCAVAASVEGVHPLAIIGGGPITTRRTRVSFAEQQQRKRRMNRAVAT